METLKNSTKGMAKCDVRSRSSSRPRIPTVQSRQRRRRAAFEAEALPHLRAIYNFALSQTRNPEVAEDVTQETFLNAFRAFRTFESGTNCKAWLFKICKNLACDRFRKLARRPNDVSIEHSEPVSFDPSFDKRVLEEHGIQKEDVRAILFGDEINRYLAELPDEFRRALLLCDVEGLSYKEAAEVMDSPLGTVRSRISRARDYLRTRLEANAPARTTQRARGAPTGYQ